MPEEWLVLALAALAGLLMVLLWYAIRNNLKVREQEAQRTQELGQLQQHFNAAVSRQVEQWKQQEYQRLVLQQREVAQREAQALLAQWRAEATRQIRREAISKSRSVTLGKVVEHIAPFFPVFPFDPRDARFLGHPIDFIVFDGASAGDVRRVVLLEVKSGSSTLSSKQRRIRDAVREGRVEWHELRTAEEGAASG